MCYLAAIGSWREARNDPAVALERYKAALCLGSAVGVPELHRAAGTRFRFDRECIRG